MTEQEALRKFAECTRRNDLEGALSALKFIPAAALNRQDEDGCDMLIEAAAADNSCAVEALLQDGRCDVTHKVKSTGKRASDFAMEGPAGSRLGQVFYAAPSARYIYRCGELIPREEIYSRIMEGTLEADEGCLLMLEDFFCAELVVNGKVAREDFEKWMNPHELYWEGQIVLLIGDEEYGKKFVNWDYIREAAEPDDWLSFLRDLPQYANRADWEKLVREGSVSAWRNLFEVRPELAAKYPQECLRKYTQAGTPFNLNEACKFNDAVTVKAHLVTGKHGPLNENALYSMPPGFLVPLPLAAAVAAGAVKCIRLLLESGADPDAFCRKYGKTPRELARGKRHILKLFAD